MVTTGEDDIWFCTESSNKVLSLCWVPHSPILPFLHFSHSGYRLEVGYRGDIVVRWYFESGIVYQLVGKFVSRYVGMSRNML
jgi:hypothetical protein